jgi:glycerol-3-phosphate cytidylyltransferase
MKHYKIGVIAGNFDVIHPGYIKMFDQMKSECDIVRVFLQSDPTIDRPNKMKPIFSLDDRKRALLALRSVDDVLTYNTEKELLELFQTQDISIRYLGEDYLERTDYTAYGLSPVKFLIRDHGWSATQYKQMIFDYMTELGDRIKDIV